MLFPLLPPQSSVVTPYALRQPLEIRSVRPEATQVPAYEALEATVDLTATYGNPFDPEEIALDARVTAPSGEVSQVPGFYSQGGKWRLRIAPREPGTHRVEVVARDRSGTVRSEFRFEAAPPTSGGFISISERDSRFFEFSNGRTYYPIGPNLPWSTSGIAGYERWLPELGRVGANYARIWLSPSWTTFGLQEAGPASEGKGAGQFDLAKAEQLDTLLRIARENGVSVMLCLDSYNVLQSQGPTAYWDQSPYNRDRGGPLRIWSDFWTDKSMRRYTRMKLRYLVARYGALRNVFAWELWNEVDLVGDFDLVPIRDWHTWAAQELKKLDPYDHPVTTSVSRTMGIRELELIPSLDFFQTHHYGSPSLATTVAVQQSRKASWGRPHLIAEIGADASGPMAERDPKGMQVKDPIWASLATGASGAAMPWWWDQYLEPQGLFPLFGAAARFVEGIDYPGERFQQTRPELSYAPGARRIRRDLVMVGKPAIWRTHNLNRPRTITFANGKLLNRVFSEAQHGLGRHPDWHNPLLFKLDLPRATRFEVEVSRVSGAGGATLRIDLDGNRVLTRDFADRDGLEKTEDLKEHAGIYAITIPKGYHTVKVENVGADWFMASYRFVDLLPPGERPAADAWSIVGNDVVLAWIRAEGRSWQRTALFGRANEAVPASIMRLRGLASGRWEAELWDTTEGAVRRRIPTKVGVDGTLRLPLPSIPTDIGIKIRRLGS
jgi:hypothetical protein